MASPAVFIVSISSDLYCHLVGHYCGTAQILAARCLQHSSLLGDTVRGGKQNNFL